MTTFVRLLDIPVEEKATVLLDAIRNGGPAVFEVDPNQFGAIHGSPFSYWVASAIRNLFSRFAPFENASRTARGGAKTQDDIRFVRGWWEPNALRLDSAWKPFAKGGAYSPYAGDVFLTIDWEDNGSRPRAFYEHHSEGASWGGFSRGEDYYYRPGITWPLRAASFSPQPLPTGCIFSVRGYAVFAPKEQLLSIIAVFSSSIFDHLFKLMLGRADFPEFIIGMLQRLPFPELTPEQERELGQLAHRAWSLSRIGYTCDETSRSFILPATIRYRDAWPARARQMSAEIAELRQVIDGRCFEAFGVPPDLRVSGAANGFDASLEAASSGEELPSSSEEDGGVSSIGDLCPDALRAQSWFVGVAFGRFDPRLATSQRVLPPEPDPFDPLPSRSPGMWPEGEEPDVLPPDILVDDSGHNHDIRRHVADAAAKTGWPDPHDLRPWLAHEFFPLHIKMYSKSRRKAPIYWQLATPSASYSVWLYIHAFTKDTLFRVQNDYAAPKLAHEERRLELARREGGFSEDANPHPYEEQRFDRVAKDLGVRTDGAKTAAAKRKELAAQEAFVEELRAFLAEVKLGTPLWTPHLDDGVVINAAPLWRLFPQHKAWQKELLGVWRSLCAGEYDWSHMAMHLWPERVVPKCADDRSLAIAHGLEDVFWVEGSNGKWTKRENPTTAVSDLVKERTSPAVKAALKKLLEAPTPESFERTRTRRRGRDA